MNEMVHCLTSLRARLRGILPFLALCAVLPAAHAADALNGKTLYLNGPSGGGTACASCHGPTPAANVNGILAAANKPEVISAAFAANRGGMGSLYNGRLSNAEIADLAAFIGNPNVVAAPAATVDPAALGFAATPVGQGAAPLSTTLSNSGNAPLNVGTLSITGAAAADYTIAAGGCAPGTVLAPGAGCTVAVGFTPGASGARNASLVINHNGAGGASSVALSGTGNATPQATIALSASAIDFGTLVAGVASPARSVTVSNTGQAALNFGSIGITGPNAGVFSVGGTCAVASPVAAGASCTVSVGANASAGGAFSGSLVLASNASNGAVSVALGGSVAAAAPALAASPSMVAFGARTIAGPADTQAVTLSNTGNVALALDGIAVTGTGAGSVTITGGTCGATLATGAACTVNLGFAPTAQGAVAAQLAVTSNAAPLQVAISGSGTTAQVARATLSENGPLAFPDTRVGQRSAVHTLTLSNGGAAALKIASLVLDGAQVADFVLEGGCAAGATVAPSSSCAIDASFKPTAAGARAASLVLMTDAGRQFTVALGGTGVAVPAPMLTVDPQSFDFGSAEVNGTAPVHRITVSNGGAAAVVVTSVNFTGPYALQAGADGCPAVPFTLQPGARCDIAVRFSPLAAGAAAGAMTLAADGGSWSVALGGSGTLATVPAGPAGPAGPQNAGGGGCSASTTGKDPVLALLVVLSIGVLAWRRFNPKQEVQS